MSRKNQYSKLPQGEGRRDREKKKKALSIAGGTRMDGAGGHQPRKGGGKGKKQKKVLFL